MRVDRRSPTQALRRTSGPHHLEEVLDRRPTLQWRGSAPASQAVPAVITFQPLALVPRRRRKLTATQVEVAPTPRTSSWRIVTPEARERSGRRRPPGLALLGRAAVGAPSAPGGAGGGGGGGGPPVLELMALAALVGLIAGFGAGVWLQSASSTPEEPVLASVR